MKTNILGFDIEGGGACPEQYDVTLQGKRFGYLRLRHGCFDVWYPDVFDALVFSGEPKGDGCFYPDERSEWLEKAIAAIIDHTSEDIHKIGCHDCKNIRYALKGETFVVCPACSPHHSKFHFTFDS